MNTQLKEINEIIALCDRTVGYIEKYGIIRAGNSEYETYKMQIKAFFNSRDDIPRNYGPYQVLYKLRFTGNNYTVCLMM